MSNKPAVVPEKNLLTKTNQEIRERGELLLKEISGIDKKQIAISFVIENVSLFFGVALILVSCLLVWVFSTLTAQLVIQIVSAGFGLIGLFYVIKNLRLTSKIHLYNIAGQQADRDLKEIKEKEHKDQDWLTKKQQVAISLISEWESTDMWKSRLFELALEEERKKPTDQQKMAEIIEARTTLITSLRDNDEDKRKKVRKIIESNDYFRADMIRIVNFFEKLGIAVNHNIAEEKVLSDFFTTPLLKYYLLFEAILNEHKTQPGNRILSNFIEVAEKWKNQLAHNNNK